MTVSELHRLCIHDVPSIRKLAILSECLLFQNLIPGYYIKVSTEQDMAQMVKKNNKQT